MKKILTTFLSFVCVSVFSQNTELTNEQMQLFIRSRLSVQPFVSTTGSGFVTQQGFSTMSAMSNVDWIGFEGSRRIDEYTFLGTAGYNKEAQFSLAHYQRKKYAITATIVFSVITISFASYGTWALFNHDDSKLFWISWSSLSIPLLTSLFIPDSDNTIPYQQAQLIADDYNNRLIKKIKNQSN